MPKYRKIHFDDFPDFTPNLTPQEIFQLGSFGGTYWRTIHSAITKKNYKNIHKKYKFSVPESLLSSPDYDKTKNKYGVVVGTSLEFWESKGWITKYHPYGWVHWYCDFYNGKRTPDDSRQINRWKRTAGENSRFRLNLINQLKRARAKYNDYTISPRIRQTLQHWAVILTADDLRRK